MAVRGDRERIWSRKHRLERAPDVTKLPVVFPRLNTGHSPLQQGCRQRKSTFRGRRFSETIRPSAVRKISAEWMASWPRRVRPTRTREGTKTQGAGKIARTESITRVRVRVTVRVRSVGARCALKSKTCGYSFGREKDGVGDRREDLKKLELSKCGCPARHHPGCQEVSSEGGR